MWLDLTLFIKIQMNFMIIFLRLVKIDFNEVVIRLMTHRVEHVFQKKNKKN